jgi:hypothetical protein
VNNTGEPILQKINPATNKSTGARSVNATADTRQSKDLFKIMAYNFATKAEESNDTGRGSALAICP